MADSLPTLLARSRQTGKQIETTIFSSPCVWFMLVALLRDVLCEKAWEKQSDPAVQRKAVTWSDLSFSNLSRFKLLSLCFHCFEW